MNKRMRWGQVVVGSLLVGFLWVPKTLWAVEAKVEAPAIQNGMTVQLNYTLTVDGKVVDTNEGKPPLSYIHGKGQIIRGLERELAGLHVGDKKEVTVVPTDGYGIVNPKAFVVVSRDKLPTEIAPQIGMTVQGMGQDGRPMRATIQKLEGNDVTLDLNHPLAGKTLQFKIEIVGISPK